MGALIAAACVGARRSCCSGSAPHCVLRRGWPRPVCCCRSRAPGGSSPAPCSPLRGVARGSHALTVGELGRRARPGRCGRSAGSGIRFRAAQHVSAGTLSRSPRLLLLPGALSSPGSRDLTATVFCNIRPQGHLQQVGRLRQLTAPGSSATATLGRHMDGGRPHGHRPIRDQPRLAHLLLSCIQAWP